MLILVDNREQRPFSFAGPRYEGVEVESSWADLAGGQYRSRLNPHAACQSVAAFMGRYRVPFLFAGSRAAAEYVTWSFLRQYLESARRRWRSIVKAHGSDKEAAA